jgi:hypothetical protein|tara:strand:+ start:1114 stop:1719 length:606 start_codon:yes stop_codon:yes gene_type:complete
MNTQNEWLLSNLLEFYQNREYLETLKQIINREYAINTSKKLSIRIVNWFVTNYAKQHFTVYEIPCHTDKLISEEDSRRFFVWTSYKSTEDSYSKQMFDPYCRQQRILIPYDGDTRIETTIGQLHFFKWAIMNKVIDYIIQHYDSIEKDMTVRLNNSVKKKPSIKNIETTGDKTRKKREELSMNACRIMRKELCDQPVKMKF